MPPGQIGAPGSPRDEKVAFCVEKPLLASIVGVVRGVVGEIGALWSRSNEMAMESSLYTVEQFRNSIGL